MPELPEVEVVKRSLVDKIQNSIVKAVKINDGRLRYRVDKNKIKKIIGLRIKKISRRSKFLLFFFILNMIALGGGPTFTGWLIDVFKENYNDLESMRYAMSVTFCIFIPSVLSFLIVSKVLPEDWSAAERRNLESTTE